MARGRQAGELLLGEWACLASITERPSHGFAVAARLAPTGDLGRVWSLSRPLTYRSLDQLLERALLEVVGEERGRNGLRRTVYGATDAGREALARWLGEPVAHVRDARSELLLKLVVIDRLGLDREPLLRRQQAMLSPVISSLTARSESTSDLDPVTVWREESALATQRFLDRLAAAPGEAHDSAAGDASS